MSERIVVSHDEIRHLIELEHYDDHPQREESAEFVRIRKNFHDSGAKCYINNGYCEGHIEIHHNEIEYSASSEVEWDRIMKDLGFDHVDSEKQMLPLCYKHHQGTGTGIHKISVPIWKLQKYLNPKNLALFEAAISHLKEQAHPNHTDPTHDDHHAINRKSAAILKKLAHNPNSIYEQRK